MSNEEANKLVDKKADELKISWIKDSIMIPSPEIAPYVANTLRQEGRLVVRVASVGNKVVTYDVDIKLQKDVKTKMLYFVRGMVKGMEHKK